MQQLHTLFPTLALEDSSFTLHEEMREAFWKNHSKHVYHEDNYQGYSGPDGYGRVLSHHDLDLEPLWCYIIGQCKNYINLMGVDPTQFVYSITKGFVNVLDDNHGNPIHHHAETHLSYIYYINVPENVNQKICFHDLRMRYEPWQGFSTATKKSPEWSPHQGNWWPIEIKENMCLIFPGNLPHSVAYFDGNKDSTLEYDTRINLKIDPNNLEDLKRSRISIVGDVFLSTINTNEYWNALQPLQNWRHFT